VAEITVEPGGVKTGPCAIYFVDWCEQHEEPRCAFLTLGIGDWDEGSSPADRRSVCVQVRPEGMSLRKQPARDRPEFFGRFLPREAALPLADSLDLWHLADHIVLDDPQVASVMSWVCGESKTALRSADSG
jgi:hypothetical protein